ncbi:MAG TPA: phosphopantetheine-binding protein [Pyrinomonadaceae bacterium]|nr:phosphopantetheine-binding protein [Pyrinomonadaceae bacterium]
MMLMDRIAQLSPTKRRLLALRLNVDTSYVSAPADDANPKRLLAYVVLDKNQTSTKEELRAYLKKRLPSYMVPSEFIAIDALPLTPNGKVDRQALPPPLRPVIETKDLVSATANSVERALLLIWTDVLGVERIGIHDNFFELGGHSLSATQVMSRVRDLFNIEIPLLAIFEEPTIKDLARQIESIRNNKGFEFRSQENREEIEL